MNKKVIIFGLFTIISLASCSGAPQWTDPEAHEKTVQLQEQYGPLLVGTWHLERIGERQRFFERLTFESDGILTGLRKWQKRNLVGTLTDWEDIPEEDDGEHQSSDWITYQRGEAEPDF